VAIVICAPLVLPVIPLWVFSSDPVMLGLGAFLMQICVQGAWGVIPAHLNELSPPEIRATFRGLVYQFGKLLASAGRADGLGTGAAARRIARNRSSARLTGCGLAAAQTTVTCDNERPHRT
jgi:MFS transporter, SHS family, lactate transporter